MFKNVNEVKEMIKSNQVSIILAEAGLRKLDIVVEALTESNDTPLEILNCSEISDLNDLNLELFLIEKDDTKTIVLDQFDRLNGQDKEVARKIVQFIRSNEYKIVLTATNLDNDLSLLLKNFSLKYPVEKLTIDTELFVGMPMWKEN